MAPIGYEEAERVVRARLGTSAAAHSIRTARTAADLAKRYGVDVEAARLGGLLHDWDREQKKQDLVRLAREAGLEVTEADEAAPKLLHARTGAHGASQALPGLDPAVVQAIARHTVGATDMTGLDKIVYLADMMEPARDFPGVEALRAGVATLTLDELFALGYQQSICHLVTSRKRLHPDTVHVWNAIVAGEKP